MTFFFDPREGGFVVGSGGGETWVTLVGNGGIVGSDGGVTWVTGGNAGPGIGGGLTAMPPGPKGGGLIATEVGESGKPPENKPFLGFFKSLDLFPFFLLSFLMSYFIFLTASAISFAPILGLGLKQN